LRRQLRSEHAVALLAFVALAAGTTWSLLAAQAQIKVAGTVTVVVSLSSLVLSTPSMVVVLCAVVICLVTVLGIDGVDSGQLTVTGLVMLSVACLVGVIQVGRRSRLGLHEIRPEAVIGLIRDRVSAQSGLPSLPDGWAVGIAQRAANGAALSGDFVTARVVRGESSAATLHVAVVDVSGNGIAAGPRSLLLSGAVGGLLGAVPAERFLPSVNDYLTRQRWPQGFASAIYLCLDLETGVYSVRTAGHPPALHYRPSASQRWRHSTATGTVLGVVPALQGTTDIGVLDEDELLLLYTDGVVEDAARDLDSGIGRLRQRAESLATDGGTQEFARALLDSAGTSYRDDRTVVVIRRRSPLAGDPAQVAAVSPQRAAARR